VLSRWEGTAAGLANIAPVAAVFIVFGALVASSGPAAPFVLLMAGIAFALHVNTVAEFNRVTPSAGFYTTYVARGFGSFAGAMAALVYSLGLVALVGALVMGLGLWVESAVASGTGYFSLSWWIPALVVELAVVALLVQGVKISVAAAATLFGFEVLVLLVGGVAMLVHNAAAIAGSGAAFDPANIPGGASGFGTAFTLAIFLFLGASASAPLSEETKDPRRAIPFAVFLATLVAALLYVFAGWAEQVGFRNSVRALTRASFPYVTAAAAVAHPFVYVMDFAGFTSATAVLIASQNVLSRVWYSLGREGLLPPATARVHRRWRTPHVAVAAGALLALVTMFCYGGVAGNGFTAATGYAAYGELATLGTDFIVLVFMVTNLALVAYYLRVERRVVSWTRHVVLPVLGTLALAYPFWESVKPTQPRPYNWFGLVLLLALAASLPYAALVCRRGARAGSWLADAAQPDTGQPEAVRVRA
jgi:amino acid transporter